MAKLQDIQIQFYSIQNDPKLIDNFSRSLIDSIYKHTNRPLLIYSSAFNSTKKYIYPGYFLSIDTNDLLGLESVLKGVTQKELDLILHSPGGSLEAAMQIVNFLKARFDHIRVIIPGSAMSAATMISCACDEIWLADQSALGPIDPQLAVRQQNGSTIQTPVWSILKELEKIEADVKADVKLAAIHVPKIINYQAGIWDICQKAIELAESSVEVWLNDRMLKQSQNGKDIAEWLGSREIHKSHSKPISYTEALTNGLVVNRLETDADLHEKVMDLHYLMSTIFDSQIGYAKIIDSHIGQAYLSIAQPQIVPNTNQN